MGSASSNMKVLVTILAPSFLTSLILCGHKGTRRRNNGQPRRTFRFQPVRATRAYYTKSSRVNSVQTSYSKLSHPLTYLGTLNATDSEKHPLGGKVFCRKDDENVLTVVNFLYTKPGPDAFFWAGGEGGCDDGSIDNRSQIQVL